MKQHWTKLAARVDALTLRERVLVFAGVAGLAVFVAYFMGLGPMLAKQAGLRMQIRQHQNNVAGVEGEIMQVLKEYQRDPDADTRAKLAAVREESARLGDSLRAMQKGLVAPERMAPLIDTILRSNGRLQLVAMKTLPMEPLNDPSRDPAPKAPEAATAATAASAPPSGPSLGLSGNVVAAAALPPPAPAQPAAAPPVQSKPGSLLYRHGVEITVRGNYLDMIDYMHALEGLPTQLFWGAAKLEVEEYPSARLTLTLFTLSLDPKWMKL